MGLAERRRIVCLSGQESARPIPARPVHSSRVAIKPAAVVKTYALQSQAGRFDQSQHVATRSPSSAVVWLGRTRWQPMWLRARRLLSMASAVVTLIVKGGRSATSDVAGLDLLPHLNEEVVDTVCVDRAPLNTTSVIVPLVDRCHRSGWLPIRVWTNSSADLDSTRRRRLLLSHSALDPRAYRAAHLHRGALPHRIDGRTVPAEQQAPGVRSASRRPILVPHSPR